MADICVALLLWVSPAFVAAELEFDHVWIVVTRAAPERAALERVGLKWWSALSPISRVPRSAPAATAIR